MLGAKQEGAAMSEKQDVALQKAFEKGQQAWREGKSINDNPYPFEAPYHDMWNQGWEAEAAIQEK